MRTFFSDPKLGRYPEKPALFVWINVMMESVGAVFNRTFAVESCG